MKHIRLPPTEAGYYCGLAGVMRCCSAARCIRHGTLPISGQPLLGRRESLCRWNWRGETIYYGPSPAKPGEAIGSAGPPPAIEWIPYTPPAAEGDRRA